LNKRALIGFVLSLACVFARAATIERFVAPDTVILRDDGHAPVVVHLSGAPVYFCGLNAFASWAQPLVGKSASVALLQSALVRAGWLRPAVLDDDAQAAMTERRGGWACASAAEPFAEMHSAVDPQLLASIALNESAYAGYAWPWTLNVAGQGFYFASRDDAYAAIRYLLSEKRCDFDIGIMQVNWCYHAARFSSPWDALAPQKNVAVAEVILMENYRKTGSAAKAVAYYHSANPVEGRAYLSRFVAHLKQIQASSPSL
jgi:hypothetical protein